jgi:UDP-3-O-[3-hydroxymyristoyl] glucosamine N-acyltransferase
MLLSELAKLLGCQLEDAGHVDVRRVMALQDAQPGDVTFLSNKKYAKLVPGTRASAVIADASLRTAPCPILRSANPYLSFAQAIAVLTPPALPAPGVSALAAIDPGASIGTGASIGAFVSVAADAVVGARTVLFPHAAVGRGSVIGEDCVIHAHVSIREGVVIGDRVVLQDAAVIGSDGFGFATRADGSHQKIPQVGRVVIEHDVEIGAHTAVDRPAVGETRIAAGAKIDNLVQVAHGVKIGRRALLAAQVGISGSTTIDEDVVFAGQSGAVGHVHIGKGAIIPAKSGVTHDLAPNAVVSGFPAFDLAEWRKASVLFRQSGRKTAKPGRKRPSPRPTVVATPRRRKAAPKKRRAKR